MTKEKKSNKQKFPSVSRLSKAEFEENTKGELEGYAVTWGYSDDGIKFEPGSFKKTISERSGKIPLLIQHAKDNSMVYETVGFITDGVEDSHGLKITASFIDTEEAQRVREKALRGGIRALSGNARVIKGEKTEDKVIATEALLREVTLTNIPKDAAAEILAVRDTKDESEGTQSEEPSEDDTHEEESPSEDEDCEPDLSEVKESVLRDCDISLYEVTNNG